MVVMITISKAFHHQGMAFHDAKMEADMELFGTGEPPPVWDVFLNVNRILVFTMTNYTLIMNGDEKL